jgi:isoquinoline 1-oxidoreductase subunit alpha
MAYTLNINGQNYTANITDGNTPLLWVLRDVLGLTGTKYGCGIEVCGACTVMIDGQREHTCKFNVSSAVGKKIVTIEGLSATNSDPVQQQWRSCQVPQCGYCQTGMIMVTAASRVAGRHGKEILSDLTHVCVCGTYGRIIKATESL